MEVASYERAVGLEGRAVHGSDSEGMTRSPVMLLRRCYYGFPFGSPATSSPSTAFLGVEYRVGD